VFERGTSSQSTQIGGQHVRFVPKWAGVVYCTKGFKLKSRIKIHMENG